MSHLARDNRTYPRGMRKTILAGNELRLARCIHRGPHETVQERIRHHTNRGLELCLCPPLPFTSLPRKSEAGVSPVTRPAIATNNLTREYGAVCALDRLTIEVPSGSIFGLLGPNAAGKTTVIRLLLGLVEPSKGEGTVLGFDIRKNGDEIRRRTGALFENPGLYERLSAYDNLEYFARIWRMPEVTRRVRIESLLRHFGLWERRFEIVGSWTRGLQQKLAISRTLLHQPPLVFLDEPTMGLDPIAAAALRKELAALSHNEGVTIFLTTHNLAEAEQLCDTVGLMRAGKLLAVGTPAELRDQGRLPQLEILGRGFDDDVIALLRKRPEVRDVNTVEGGLIIGLSGDVDTSPLVSLLVESGVDVQEVRRLSTTLESTFLTFMEELA